MSDMVPAVVEDRTIEAITHETLQAAVDQDLIDRCVYIKSRGVVRWDAIWRRLNENAVHEDEKVAPETVQACVRSKEFARAWRVSQDDPQGTLTKRLRSTSKLHEVLDGADYLASQANADKRTRAMMLQWRAGVGGITPQTQISVGPNEDFLKLVERALTKRSGNGEA